MGRKRLGDDDTVVVSVRMSTAERERLKVAAAAFGKPMAEFSRLVLTAAADGANQHLRRPAPELQVSETGADGHTHRAGPMKSGGIHDCTERGCRAKKVSGRWVEVT